MFYMQDESTEQQNNHTSPSGSAKKVHLEAQKSDVYDKLTDKYTTITFNSSAKFGEPKPQYLELGLKYQDVKQVYSELSTDQQRYGEEPFCRELPETVNGEYSPPSNMIYHTLEEEGPTYEENNYYSAVETLPDELSSPAPVYAKVKK